MAQLSGHWLEDPPLVGPQLVAVDGITFHLPKSAVVKIVQADGFQIAHAKIGVRVIVLSRHGALVESDIESRARATPENWRAVAGD